MKNSHKDHECHNHSHNHAHEHNASCGSGACTVTATPESSIGSSCGCKGDSCQDGDDGGGDCDDHHVHLHEHNHGDGCGCPHDKPPSKTSLYIIAISTVLFIIALLIPNSIIQTILFGASVIIAGYDLFFTGIKQLLKFRFEENVLLLIAVVASFALGEFPEACIVTILFKLGGFIEGYAINRSQKNMEALTKIRPDFATIKDENGDYISVDAKTINIGDTVYLRAGERVAVDCTVIDGQSSIDSSALTGEAIPQSISAGDKLLSGSINLTGVVECKADASFENSTASQIIELVYSSAKAKGKTEGFISRVAKVYTPIVIILALIIATVPPLLSLGTFNDFIMRSLIFLVASCPCALVISIPLSFFSSIGAVSKQGVLVKGSMFIERLAKVNAVAFDKTGTLTSGKLSVDEVVVYNKGIERSQLLSILSAMEKNSTHPIAVAIENFCGKTDELPLKDIEELAGFGLQATLDNNTVLCGGQNMLIKNGIDISRVPPASVYVCINNAVVGYVTIKEEIPQHSLTIVKELKKADVRRVVMLTGDNKANANKVAEKCGIDEVYSSLLPVDKVKMVEKVKQDGNTVLFVGDGINDAPVLTVADLGVSMGLGSEIANVSSDIILASNNISSLPKAIKIAKRSMSVVYFNIIFALAIKIIVLILGGLGHASMWFAVFADIGVTILTVLNATRLLGRNKYE